MKTKSKTSTRRTNVSMNAVVYQCSRELMREMTAASFSNLVARLVTEKCLSLGLGITGKEK